MTQRASPGADIPPLHYILLGTFRHPVIYTLSFNPYTRCLKHHGETLATGGHSWLTQSPDGSTVYATVWNQDAPRLAAYRITSPKPCLVASPSGQRSEAKGDSLTLDLINECELDHLSGCVCANATTVFSASGPQCDVIPIDASTGGFASPIAAQSLAFIDSHAGSEQGHQRIIGADKAQSFGGLRHGGHSTELSPDGTKFYVADIGRNCVWIYQVSGSQPSRLTLLSQYRSRRLNDGPRHTWPHPNGRIVYCVQEHSSVVDVLEHEGDDLVWRQGAKILPEHKSCSDFWADGMSCPEGPRMRVRLQIRNQLTWLTESECCLRSNCMFRAAEVRTDPLGRVLFGSTRGLAPTEPGYLCAWPLLESGWINLDASGDHRNNMKVSMDNIPACHTLQTPTSGGWANAIGVCAALGPRGETWLTLTDSEEGHLWVVSWTEEAGFEIVQDFQLPKDGRGDAIGASVGIWIM